MIRRALIVVSLSALGLLAVPALAIAGNPFAWQEEDFAAAQDQQQGDPARQAREAIRVAQAALRDAEDALDQV